MHEHGSLCAKDTMTGHLCHTRERVPLVVAVRPRLGDRLLPVIIVNGPFSPWLTIRLRVVFVILCTC